jgi:Tlde1 domain
MFDCPFELDDLPMRVFSIGALKVAAFSGRPPMSIRRIGACVRSQGPIPAGEYYIFDRQGGGRLQWLRNIFSDRSEWFALYAVDGRIDDETCCGQVRRGRFRLHARGPRGISEGCITIDRPGDFQRIRERLRSVPPSAVPGTPLLAYGKVRVR